MRIPTDRQIPGAPALLTSFAVYSLVTVAMVVWVSRSDSRWVLALAVVVVLGLAARLLLALRRMLGGGEKPVADGGRLRRRTLLLAGLPAVIVPLVVVSVVHAEPRPQDTPVATVRDFLSAAVADDDGETACEYLTPQARLDFEGRRGLRSTCQSFFSGAELELGGLVVASNEQLDELHYSVERDGPERIVTLSHDGQAMRFVLRRGNEVELNGFDAPPTPWRIDSSVDRLGEPDSSLGV